MKACRECRKQKPRQKGTRNFCCGCKFGFLSPDDADSNSDRLASVSTLAHAMIQERLDQMVKEIQQARCAEGSKQRVDRTKFLIIAATEKYSYDPQQDFRNSMIEMIVTQRIDNVKVLRRLLNYYLSINTKESWSMILEVFHDVCTDLFIHCKQY